MPEIKLTIDCGEKLCGDCHFRGFNSELYRYYPYCEAFRKDLEEHRISKRKKGFVRCRECLDAETKETAETCKTTSTVIACSDKQCDYCTDTDRCDVYKTRGGK